jgi:hypothetical protein
MAERHRRNRGKHESKLKNRGEVTGAMAHITSKLEAENDLTVVTVVGGVDAEQVQSQIISFLTGDPTPLVLWDVRAGSLTGLSGEDIRTIIQSGAWYADRRKGGRTAIVCPREVDYGLGRMFESLASIYHIPFEINVFRNLGEAREWLNQGRRDGATGAI